MNSEVKDIPLRSSIDVLHVRFLIPMLLDTKGAFQPNTITVFRNATTFVALTTSR
jgi:hypothetical protein